MAGTCLKGKTKKLILPKTLFSFPSEAEKLLISLLGRRIFHIWWRFQLEKYLVILNL